MNDYNRDRARWALAFAFSPKSILEQELISQRLGDFLIDNIKGEAHEERSPDI